MPAHALAAIADSPQWSGVPESQRDRVRNLHGLFLSVPPRPAARAALAAIAARLEMSESRLRALYYKWRRAGRDWAVLVSGHVTRAQATRDPRLQSKSFLDYFRKLVEDNQRSTDAGIRALWRQWDLHGETIPGYEDWAGWPQRPPSWSRSNLRRLQPTKTERGLIRDGLNKSRKHLAQVHRTRVGLWPGSHYVMDDLWHDNFVRFQGRPCRVQEFGALDLWSACRYHWGNKPRVRTFDADGNPAHRELTERDFRFFLAGVLWEYGIHRERGTTLVLEHAKTTLPRRIIDLLEDYGITVNLGGLSGERQAILGLWGGRSGGSPNSKSWLESLHNLMHNELAALPGQTGKDREHRPETTHGLLVYQAALMDWAATLPPEVAEKVRHPLMEYETQFLPALRWIYDYCINGPGRDPSRIEGWLQMERQTTEYRLDLTPGRDPADTWMRLEQIPEASRSALSLLVRSDPATWSRTRLMTPGEVWAGGRSQLTRPSIAVIWDILSGDEAAERKVHGAYFRFSDKSIDPGAELLYESRIITPDGKPFELTNGETYATMGNPFAPDTLLVGDAQHRCLGYAPRVHRTCVADADAWARACGHAAARNAEIMRPLRDRWEPEERAAQDLRQHNADLGFSGVRPAPGRKPRRDSGAREAAAADARDTRAAAAAHRRDAQSAPADVDLDDASACPFY